MATLTEIREAIRAKLAAVPAIGTVHAYERYSQRTGDIQALYTADIDGAKQLRGWFVRRVGTVEQDIAATAGGRYVVRHTWRITGYMAFADAAASELAFDDLIEAIRDAFRADITLGGKVSAIENQDQAGIAVDSSEPVLFCGVLCHSARLSLSTFHYQ